MRIPKADRLTIYRQLFKVGVICAQKDFTIKHKETKVDNLFVIKLLQSFVQRGYAEEKFVWQWYFWTLTEDGVTYLREFLHLPEDVIPESYKPKLKTQQDALRRYQDGRKRFSRDGRTDTRRTFGNRRPRDGAQGNEYRPRGFFNRNQTGEKRTFGDRPRFSRTGGFGGDRNFQRRQDGDTQNRKHVWNIRKTDENQANQAPTESNNN